MGERVNAAVVVESEENGLAHTLLHASASASLYSLSLSLAFAGRVSLHGVQPIRTLVS
jgi:hypothetical protein